MVRPTLSTGLSTLEGEAVIARYLSRLLKSSSPYQESDSLAAVTETDYYLDLAESFLYGEKKDENNVVSVLSKKLSSSAYLGGTRASLADLVLWSAVSQKSSAKLPATVNAWKQRCQQASEFSKAAQLL